LCKEVNRVSEALGCGSIEFDLGLTRDGVLVVTHDRTWRGRALRSLAYEEVREVYPSLEGYVEGLARAGLSFDTVNLDLKERNLSFRRRRWAGILDAHRPSLDRLAALSGRLVFSSPVPPVYAQLHEYIRSRRLESRGWWPGLELVDYTSSQARAWGLPLSRLERFLLPLARGASSAYWRVYRDSIPYVLVQEQTAASLASGPRARVLCWTREPAPGEPPPSCDQTTRRRS